MRTRQRAAASPLVLLASVVGVLTLLYPFLLPAFGGSLGTAGHGIMVPVLFSLLAVVCLITIVLDVQGGVTGRGSPARRWSPYSGCWSRPTHRSG